MGLKNSIIEAARDHGISCFTQTQWLRISKFIDGGSQFLEKIASSNFIKTRQIYKSKLTNFMVDQYSVKYHNIKNIKQYMDHFFWRNQCQQLVHCILINWQQNNGLCQPSGDISFYLQHIPLRLSQIKDIPFPQNIYILREVLLAYQYIYKRMQVVQVQQDFICINKDFKIKVWINSNLVEQEPQISLDSNMQRAQQKKLVKRIIQLIAQNTDHLWQPFDIRQFLKQKNSSYTFKQVLELLSQFADFFRILVPNNLQSVYMLFEGAIHRRPVYQTKGQATNKIKSIRNGKYNCKKIDRFNNICENKDVHIGRSVGSFTKKKDNFSPDQSYLRMNDCKSIQQRSQKTASTNKSIIFSLNHQDYSQNQIPHTQYIQQTQRLSTIIQQHYRNRQPRQFNQENMCIPQFQAKNQYKIYSTMQHRRASSSTLQYNRYFIDQSQLWHQIDPQIAKDMQQLALQLT